MKEYDEQSRVNALTLLVILIVAGLLIQKINTNASKPKLDEGAMPTSFSNPNKQNQ